MSLSPNEKQMQLDYINNVLIPAANDALKEMEQYSTNPLRLLRFNRAAKRHKLIMDEWNEILDRVFAA